MDPQLKQLMKELGDAINQTCNDSELIKAVIDRIKEGGYDIFLKLETTIRVRKHGTGTTDLPAQKPSKDALPGDAMDPELKQLMKESGSLTDPKLKQFMKELGGAIDKSLSDSDQISEVVIKARVPELNAIKLGKPSNIGR